ncbi:MAG TPA: DUF1192 domain-containing protein [Rhizomicrobium sp.]
MAMDLDELLPKKKPEGIRWGEDLSTMSEHELDARIALLELEIQRCREAILSRRDTRVAADSIFRKR